uniref:Uncharacterized protein n=1 Tax=Parascaris equorum TaxID=6256 RepID=A0A914RAZ9_PAREQ
MSVEYDKEGRLHYIPKSLSRSASYDRQREGSTAVTSGEGSSLTDDDDGTNILYKIRREELARGGQPSVRLMAKAFDSIEATVLTPAAPSAMAVTVLGRNTSLSQIEELMGSQSPYGATLQRGGRNPFKNMGMSAEENCLQQQHT